MIRWANKLRIGDVTNENGSHHSAIRKFVNRNYFYLKAGRKKSHDSAWLFLGG